MSRRVSCLLVLATCLVLPASVVAQTTSRPHFGNGSLWAVAASEAATPASNSTGILGDGSRDFRYRGFWVGAGVGLGLTYIGYQLCNDPDTSCDASAGKVILRSTFVVGMLGTIGALVGAQFDR